MTLESENHDNQEELSLDKKSILCGILITLTFLTTAAILYFSSSKQSMQISSLIFATLSVFVGLTGGVITYCCNERNPDYDLSGARITTTTVFENKTKLSDFKIDFC